MSAALSQHKRGFGPRSRGRELALKYLYAVDVAGQDMAEDFESFVVTQKERGAAVDFARELVQGVLAHRADLDAELQRQAANWSLDRMAVIDRNILRLGCFELLHVQEIPARATLNEAVELAKRFSTDRSSSFVNGILDQVQRLAPKETPPCSES